MQNGLSLEPSPTRPCGVPFSLTKNVAKTFYWDHARSQKVCKRPQKDAKSLQRPQKDAKRLQTGCRGVWRRLILPEKQKTNHHRSSPSSSVPLPEVLLAARVQACDRTILVRAARCANAPSPWTLAGLSSRKVQSWLLSTVPNPLTGLLKVLKIDVSPRLCKTSQECTRVFYKLLNVSQSLSI